MSIYKLFHKLHGMILAVSTVTFACTIATAQAQESAASNLTEEEIKQIVEDYLAERETKESQEKESANEPKSGTWSDRLSFSGDFQLRHESQFEMEDGDKNVESMRLRIGAKYKVHEQLELGGRVVTGDSDNPRSADVGFGDVFDGFPLSLDLLYLTYRPEWLDGGWITAGKFLHPQYMNPVYGGLVWDGDLQPEGIAAGYSIDGDGCLENLTLTGGYYLMDERTVFDDTTVLQLQAASRFRLGENTKLNVALGFTKFSDTNTPGDIDFSESDNFGNATVDVDMDMIADAFVSDFTMLNPVIALTYDGWKVPVTVSAEYIENLDAEIDEDSAFSFGFALGTQEEKGDLKAYYNYQVVEQDAVLSTVAQDDFAFTTNFRGHLIGLSYMFTDNIQLHTWALGAERDETSVALGTDDDLQWKLRFDLNILF